MVSGQLPPEENSPLVRVGVWVKVRVSFRVGGGNHTIAPEEPFPRLRLGFGLGLAQFPSGEIVLKPTK